MKHKIQKRILSAVIGYIVFVALAYPAMYAYEMFTPTSWWFEYGDITPMNMLLPAGEPPYFHSEIEYKRGVSIQWFDYLWCKDDGSLVKYQTQVWPEEGLEPKQPGIVGAPDEDGNLPTWAYTKEPISPTATSCTMCGVVVGHTPLFDIEKTYYHKECGVVWFEVNK